MYSRQYASNREKPIPAIPACSRHRENDPHFLIELIGCTQWEINQSQRGIWRRNGCTLPWSWRRYPDHGWGSWHAGSTHTPFPLSRLSESDSTSLIISSFYTLSIWSLVQLQSTAYLMPLTASRVMEGKKHVTTACLHCRRRKIKVSYTSPSPNLEIVFVSTWASLNDF